MGALAAALALVATSAPDADARERRARATVNTERGAATGETHVRRERGQRTRDTTWTGENGRQRQARDERQWNREEGTYSRDRDVTYSDGSTRAVDVDAQRTAPGEYSATREVTGRNGETRRQTGDFTAARTENGRVIQGDISTTHAGDIDYNREVTRGDGARSVNSSATFEDGTSINRASTGACADGSCSSSGAITNRQGETTTWDQTRTRTETGAVRERDVTYADGSTRSVDAERAGNDDGTGTVTRTVTGRNGETRTQTGDYEVDRAPE
jgi:hypothetical protein